jgi:hypothetical protein
VAKMEKKPFPIHKQITKKAKTNYVEKLLRKINVNRKALRNKALRYKTYPQGFILNP